MNMYFLSLKYTSPTFIASMVNIIVPLTFAIAVVLRLESFDLRDPRGVAKVLGTLISLSGVMTMTIYKGPTVQQFWHPLIHEARLGKVATDDYHQNWLMGSVLMVTSCVKRYPARLSLTTWMSALGTAQSAVFTVIVEREKAAWMIGFNIDLWSTIYGGVVISGFVIFIQLWCTDEKGPVFVTVFGPLTTILVAILAYFIVGENLYLGSIVGAAIVIVGLYLLLWGKEDDEKAEKMIKLDEETLPSNVDLTLKTPKATTANS
ncbi:WAT1-related protein At4g08300 [Linum perenne]